MTQPEEITEHIDRIANLLESHGYAIDVHYQTATIIVWNDNWPVVVEARGRGGGEGSKAKGKR
ncbi:MAG: hypothetical protein ACKV2V_26670 [Blastocatellia bacterium]